MVRNRKERRRVRSSPQTVPKDLRGITPSGSGTGRELESIKGEETGVLRAGPAQGEGSKEIPDRWRELESVPAQSRSHHDRLPIRDAIDHEMLISRHRVETSLGRVGWLKDPGQIRGDLPSES